MAHTDEIDQKALDSVAIQLSKRLTASGRQAFASGLPMSMGDSLTVWGLRPDAPLSFDQPFANVIVPTGIWHHQIQHGGSVAEFARTKSSSGELVIQEVVSSDIARSIDAALEWIDEDTTEDPLVRLLVVPSYYLHALWLQFADRTEIVVADRPSAFGALELHRRYSQSEFLRLLSTLSPASGVTGRSVADVAALL